MRRIIFVVCLFASMAVEARQWTADEVKGIIKKVNTYWQTNNPAEVRSFWDNAAYHTGNMEVYKLLGDQQMLDYSIRWAEHNQWKGATEGDPAKWKYKTYGEGQDYVLFGDWQICFQTFIDLYNLQADETKVARAKEVMGYEADSKANDYWWWADALYMVMPVMTKMYRLTGDTKYLRKLYENILYSDSIMLDRETGLYYRDGRYVYPLNTRPRRERKTSGHVATDGYLPDWPRCFRICLLTMSVTRSSWRSSRTLPVAWQSVSSHKVTGPVRCSTHVRLPATRLQARHSSATDCSGA